MGYRVEINYSRCTTPFNCKKCIQLCPQAVFMVGPVKIERGRQTDKTEPGSYKAEAYFPDKCTACNVCIDICPVNAITITEVGRKKRNG